MATTLLETESEEVKDILRRAQREGVKGRYYVFERYKSELIEACRSSLELEKATIDLARILRV